MPLYPGKVHSVDMSALVGMAISLTDGHPNRSAAILQLLPYFLTAGLVFIFYFKKKGKFRFGFGLHNTFTEPLTRPVVYMYINILVHVDIYIHMSPSIDIYIHTTGFGKKLNQTDPHRVRVRSRWKKNSSGFRSV